MANRNGKRREENRYKYLLWHLPVDNLASAASFDGNDHCVTAGWATFHKQLPRWSLCRLLQGHVLPAKPKVADGHRPDNCTRCIRCHASMSWFVLGQHRYGSYNKDVFDRNSGLSDAGEG